LSAAATSPPDLKVIVPGWRRPAAERPRRGTTGVSTASCHHEGASGRAARRRASGRAVVSQGCRPIGSRLHRSTRLRGQSRCASRPRKPALERVAEVPARRRARRRALALVQGLTESGSSSNETTRRIATGRIPRAQCARRQSKQDAIRSRSDERPNRPTVQVPDPRTPSRPTRPCARC